MATSTGTIFTLVCRNESSRSGSFCVFQKDPTLGVSEAKSVAWLVQPAHPTTTVTFQWTTTYNFVWSQTGELASGVVAAAVQVWDANLDTSNQVTLTYVGGAFTFENQTAGSDAGKLYVMEDQTIPPDVAAVGIGMAGEATFLAQAQPNQTLIFTPDPQIWLSFGDYTTGLVLDGDAIDDAVEISYANNVFSMTATLNEDNTWTVSTTAAVNEALLQGRAEDPAARWGSRAEGRIERNPSNPRGNHRSKVGRNIKEVNS